MRDYSKSWRQLQQEKIDAQKRQAHVLWLFVFVVMFACYFAFATRVFGQMPIY